MEYQNRLKPLDGLRTIALLGVFAYHLFPQIVHSGYLGVVIFFVLAGFLSMNEVINRENANTSFYNAVSKIIKKVYKLIPMLLLLVLSVSIVMNVFFRNFLKSYPFEALSSIFFFNNIAQILRHESYFDAMNSMKPLTHLWALALEMQFYVVFFFTIFLCYKKENKNKIIYSLLIFYAISQVLTIVLFIKGASLTRIYYGLDTRLNAFIIGMLASLISMDFDISAINTKLIKYLEIIIFVPIIVLMFIQYSTDSLTVIVLVGYSILCAFLIFLIMLERKVAKKSILYKTLSSSCFDYLVERSYIIYLTHYPIAIFASRFLAHTKVNLIFYSITLVPVTLIISEIFYKIDNFVFKKNKKNISYAIIVMLLFLNVVILIYSNNNQDLIEEKESIKQTFEIEETFETVENISIVEKTENIDDIVKANEEKYKIERVYKYIDKVNSEIGGDAILSHEEFNKNFNFKITMIGDSVTECAKNAMALYFPDSYIDAEANRQYTKAYSVFKKLKEKTGKLGDVVVVALGTNSDRDINVEDIEKVYNAAEGKPVVLLTIITPLLMEEQKRNKVIIDFANTHTNCFICDWYSIMKTHQECFQGDNTHPMGTGTLAFAQILFKTCVYAIENQTDKEFVNERFSYLSNYNKGDVLPFGKYKITDINNKTPMEWIVVDKRDDVHTLFLVSKYAIDCKKYNLTYNTINWERSYIRSWLNSDFYNTAFDDEEKTFIREKTVSNEKNPIYGEWDQNTTKDNVFLLSYNEVKKYLTEKNLYCIVSNFARQNGIYEDVGHCDWWLRTLGDKSSNVMYVSSDGNIVMEGDYCTTDDFGIRPAIYIRYE